MSLKSTQQVLEEALAADFEDIAAHAAYSDLLAEQGDPRGEYIRLQLATEDPSRPAAELIRLRQRASELFETYQREWLGDLATFLMPARRASLEPMNPNHDYRFRRGWLVALEVRQVREAFLKVLARSPEARLLHELTLADTRHRTRHTSLAPLADATYLRSLRSLTLGDRESYACTAVGSEVVAVVRNQPRLQELTILAVDVDTEALFALPLPSLRYLHVGYAERVPLGVLGGNASLGSLTHLHLEVAADFYREFGILPTRNDTLPLTLEAENGSARVGRDEIRALLTSPHLERLACLRLRLPGVGDTLCEELVRSGMLAQLNALSLRNCEVTDAGAALLAQCCDTRHLKQLDVGMNRLTRSGIDRLNEVGIRIQCDSQFFPFGEEGDGGDDGYDIPF